MLRRERVIWNARNESICNFKHGGQGRPRWKGTFWVKIWKKWLSELTSEYLGEALSRHINNTCKGPEVHVSKTLRRTLWLKPSEQEEEGQEMSSGAADSGASLVRTLVSHLKDVEQKSWTVRFTFELLVCHIGNRFQEVKGWGNQLGLWCSVVHSVLQRGFFFH